MRKVLIWILPLFALAWSCAKDDAGTAERAKARLTLNILEEGPRLAARAADEKAVQDVNVFLYDVLREVFLFPLLRLGRGRWIDVLEF